MTFLVELPAITVGEADKPNTVPFVGVLERLSAVEGVADGFPHALRFNESEGPIQFAGFVERVIDP